MNRILLLSVKIAEICLLSLIIILCSDRLWADEHKLPPLHHRSDLVMPEGMTVPLNLDFEVTAEGHKKVVCNTCHGIKDIQDQDFEKLDKHQKEFLQDGPYEKLTDFCYLCHEKKQNDRENIHILLDTDLPEGKQKKEKQCLYCHYEVLKPDELDMTAELQPDLKLRLAEDKICYGCHLKTTHLNAVEHQVEMEDEMVLHLEKSEKRFNVNMPLTKENHITCVTCHDPHQQGVLKEREREEHLQVNADLETGVSYKKEHPWAEVYANDKKERIQALNKDIKLNFKLPVQPRIETTTALQYQRIDNEVLLRLPAKNGMLCIACHDFSEERLW